MEKSTHRFRVQIFFIHFGRDFDFDYRYLYSVFVHSQSTKKVIDCMLNNFVSNGFENNSRIMFISKSFPYVCDEKECVI